MVEFSMPVGLWPLVNGGLIALRKEGDPVVNRVMDFFRDRLHFYLEAVEHCRYDTARAVIAGEWKNPADAVLRARAIEKVRDTEDYAALAAAAKRTRNILKKSASPEEYQSGALDAALLQEEAEIELHRAYGAVFQASAEGGVAAQDYETVLTLTARLRPQIDRFFDKVLVMHPDARIRKNRLLLLRLLETEVFSKVADLSEIESNVGASTKASASTEP
jgi:glycyl-tRNA synthetase beta chain